MNSKCLNPTISPKPGVYIKLRPVLIALFCAVIVFGCAQIRKVTYPGDFVYLDRKQLRSKMAMLSLYMRDLDGILLDESTVSREQQQRVLGLLNKIKAVTAELGGGVTTNHLVIDDHIDQFKNDVNTAIFNARANPPNYFALGRLSGSCTGCHRYRD